MKLLIRGLNQVSNPKYKLKNITPVTLVGVIVPWTKFVHKEKNTDFKIITESGMEYFLVTENKLKNNIADYCWSRVKVQGTIDLNLMTLKVDRIHIDDRELEMNFYSENLMQAKQEPYLTYEPAREV